MKGEPVTRISLSFARLAFLCALCVNAPMAAIRPLPSA